MTKTVTLTEKEWDDITAEIAMLKEIKDGKPTVIVRNPYVYFTSITIINPDEAITRLTDIIDKLDKMNKQHQKSYRDATDNWIAEMQINKNIKSHWLLRKFIKK